MPIYTYVDTALMNSFIPLPSSPGVAALSDHRAAPWPHDGGPQWQWQVHGLEGPAEGSGAPSRDGGCGPCHRPQGHFQGAFVRSFGSKHTRVDRRTFYPHLTEVRHLLARGVWFLKSSGFDVDTTSS